MVMVFRNLLFNLRWLKTYPIQQKSITVGNLSAGGTGKTPHILYLEKYFAQSEPVVVVSRGYGRDTRGLLRVTSGHDVREIGDEPMLFMQHKSPNTEVLLAEKRLEAIHYIEDHFPSATVLLDDAYQHRWVKAHLQILLTSFHDPFIFDFLLPAGNLREPRNGANRCDIILVTKTPHDATDFQKSRLKEGLKRFGKPVFFSSFKYATPQSFNQSALDFDPDFILLVTGIADEKPLFQHLSKQYRSAELHCLKFPDHHDFTEVNMGDIHDKFNKFAPSRGIILSTEKDGVKINQLRHKRSEWLLLPWYIQHIEVQIEKEDKFLELIKK